jgi:hypothetical protein
VHGPATDGLHRIENILSASRALYALSAFGPYSSTRACGAGPCSCRCQPLPVLRLGTCGWTVDRVEHDGLWRGHGKVCSGRRRRRLRRASRCTVTTLRVYCAQIAQGLAHNAPTVACGNSPWSSSKITQVTLRHFSALLVRHKCQNRSSSGVRQCWDASGGA